MNKFENLWPQIEEGEKIEEEKGQQQEKGLDDAKNEEMSEMLAYLIGDMQFLKNKKEATSDLENYKRRSAETFREIETFVQENGGHYVENVNELYKRYENSRPGSFITRRENPEKVMRLINGESINIEFDPKVVAERGDKYANCAIWPYGQNPVGGIKNSFLEGRGMAGPIVTLIASKNNPENIDLTEPKDRLMKVGDISREAVRIVSGEINKDDLEFIIIRMQKDFFPEEKLTDKEKEGKVKQVFRGFILNK